MAKSPRVLDKQILLPEGSRLRFVSIETGKVTRELRLPGPPFASAVSANNRWFAAAGEKLSVIDVTTLKIKTIPIKSNDAGPVAVTSDGRYVYRMAHGGRLLMWDMKTAKFKETLLERIREVHSNVDFMTLGNDDKWVAVAGNHGDVGIFDRETSRLVSYTRVSAAAFWVERIWIRGDRIIFTTDVGALFDGRLK